MPTIFLCGDVMTGRGVDQVLGHPGLPWIEEPAVRDARVYVELAERRSGPIPRRVPPTYVWGEALDELERVAPAARIVNLETSVTASEDLELKGINYRMHPENVSTLTAARIDACVLANNHVLDYGESGLIETLETLERVELETAGAGRDLAAALEPAVIPIPGGRVLTFAFAHGSSGVPPGAGATANRPGVALLRDLSDASADEVRDRVARARRATDLVVASIHWGTNWGYDVPEEQVRFAHRLVEGGVDVVHGHSSHHPRPVEVHRGRLILYGCGDFINDYEGIEGYEPFRGDLALAYFVTLRPGGALESLDATPMRRRSFRLQRASAEEAAWLRGTLDDASARFGARFELAGDAPAPRLRLVPGGRDSGWTRKDVARSRT